MQQAAAASLGTEQRVLPWLRELEEVEGLKAHLGLKQEAEAAEEVPGRWASGL